MVFKWDDKNVKKLKQMLKNNIATKEIAEKLGGISRNAVLGKIYRLGLSSQKKDSNYSNNKSKYINYQNIKFNDKSCQWPFGVPGEKNFRFCKKEALPGNSYCKEHFKIAYKTKKQ